MDMEYSNLIFELSGKEGTKFKDLKVTSFYQDDKWHSALPNTEEDIIHFMVEVIGFYDDLAPSRDWGDRP
jgi:hypothetical protein